MDIFGFQFSYAPTLLSGVGAFALLAMLVATGGFVLAYLVGVIASVRIVAIRERRRAAAKKRKLKDLLAMKAAQDELDIELEREMHGIRPTSNLTELEILRQEAEMASVAEPADVAEEVSPEAAPVEIVAAESVTASHAESESGISEPAVFESAPAAEPAMLSFAESEPVAEQAIVLPAESSEPSSEPVAAFSFAAPDDVPEPVLTAEPVVAVSPESPAEVSSPFGFAFASEPADSEPPAPAPEPAKAEEPAAESSSPFGFSFAVDPEPAAERKPEEKKPKKVEPEVEMSSFFTVS